MSVDKVIANTLRIARQDLADAKLLAGTGSRNAAYLCEQAAEKVIRAVLTSEGIHAGTGHALAEMVKKIPDANPLKPEFGPLVELAGYATSYRYSTESRIPPTPNPAELEADLACVEAVLAEVAGRLGVDLSTTSAPASKPHPIR